MTKKNEIQKLQSKIELMETKIKHLTNELKLTMEESETATDNYFEIYSQMEDKVKKRTKDISEINKHLNLEVKERRQAEKEKEQLIEKLQKTLSDVKKLSGLLPICASCKKIRDDKGYWNQIESYIRDHSEANFSHGICPDCKKKLYPDLFND